jgi:hypothetical protein
MSGTTAKFTYKQLQTLKHALIVYQNRDDATISDTLSEEVLLGKLEDIIERMEYQNGIGRSK